MQGRVILNRNSNFQKWAGGAPDNWTTGGDAAVFQLDRHLPRKHPARRVFPSHLKAHDLVKNGDFAVRFSDVDGGDSGTLLSESIPIAPGQQISVSFQFRYDNVASTFNCNIVLYDVIAQTTEIARVVQPANPNIQNLIHNAPDTQQIGNQASYNLRATGSVVLDESIGNSPRPGYWRRYGAQFEVPAGAHAMTIGLEWDGTDAGDALDVDDFRVEALNSRVHAGG